MSPPHNTHSPTDSHTYHTHIYCIQISISDPESQTKMVSSFGPGIDGKIMSELLPKVTQLCSGRAFLQREGHMSKEEHLLDRRTDITDDLYYPENYKIGMKAHAQLYEHDAIANPYLNAAARIITRYVRKLSTFRHERKLRYMDYLIPREDGTYTRADEEFIHLVRELDFDLVPPLDLTHNQKDWCNSVWVQERRTVARSDLLDHVCCMQDVHVHLNTCRWSKRVWRLETWGADEKPFCMSLNQAIRQNKNTNVTAMYVLASYEELEIEAAWQVAQEVVWRCEDDNKSYWSYIEDHFGGSEEQFLEWSELHDTEPWGTQEEMEMFASKEELYEYLDAIMDEQDRVLEDTQFHMESDW